MNTRREDSANAKTLKAVHNMQKVKNLEKEIWLKDTRNTQNTQISTVLVYLAFAIYKLYMVSHRR